MVAQRLTDTHLNSYKIVNSLRLCVSSEATLSCTHVFSGNIVVVDLFCHHFEETGCLCVQNRVTE